LLRSALVIRKPSRDAAFRAKNVSGSKRIHSANLTDVQSAV
jgi:hypothetical protein